MGVGAPVYDFLPDSGLLVIGYLEGRTFEANDVAANLSRIASNSDLLLDIRAT